MSVDRPEVYANGEDGRRAVAYRYPSPQEGDWAWRRIQDIRIAMSGRHETGFVDIVDNILAKGLAE